MNGHISCAGVGADVVNNERTLKMSTGTVAQPHSRAKWAFLKYLGRRTVSKQTGNENDDKNVN